MCSLINSLLHCYMSTIRLSGYLCGDAAGCC